MELIPLNDLSRKKFEEIDKMTNLFREIYASGHYLKGRYTSLLESSLSSLLDDRPVIAVGNGTDALTIALASLSLTEGSKIALVPNAGGYGTIAVKQLGYAPVYVDINIETAQMCPKSLEKTLSADSGIKAVITTHLYGLCGDILAIAEICRRFDVPLIEDCAQSIGAKVEHRWAGSFGQLSTFSFYPTKNLGGMGDGGAISCESDHLAEVVGQLAQYGWGERYSVEIPNGVNSRIDEIQAALIVNELQNLHEHNQKRREIISRYSNSLSVNRRMILEDSECFVGHLAVMVTPTRSDDRERLHAQKIQTGVHYPILDFHQPAWLENSEGRTPNAVSMNKQIVTLPCFPTMTDGEINRVCAALSELS